MRASLPLLHGADISQRHEPRLPSVLPIPMSLLRNDAASVACKQNQQWRLDRLRPNAAILLPVVLDRFVDERD